MAIDEYRDIEEAQNMNGLEGLEEPLIQKQHSEGDNDDIVVGDHDDGSLTMLLLSTFVAVCGSFEFGCCVGYSAPTQSAIRDELGFSLSQYSMFGSILTVGAMVGAITSGRTADYFGRKWAMRISSFFCILGWLAVSFARGAMSLDIGRFLTGYGIGVLSYVVPVFIAEIAPKNLRGTLTTLNGLMIVIGTSFIFIAGSFVSWRILALIGVVPCIALLLGLFLTPESPRWLATIGRQKEFKIALTQLRGVTADITEEASEIQECIISMQAAPKAKLLDLFQSRYIRAMTVGVGLMLFQQLGGTNGIGFYVSETFIEAGLSSGTIGTMAYAVLQLPSTVLGAVLIDKLGRRPLIMISATGAFVGCLLTATGFLLKSYGAFLELVPFMGAGGLLMYISFYSMGMGSVPWVIMSEIFPIDVKGVAGSMVVLINWAGAWLVSYTYNFLMRWSHAGTFYMYMLSWALSVLFVAKVVPETKGKTLEEIQAVLSTKEEVLE